MSPLPPQRPDITALLELYSGRRDGRFVPLAVPMRLDLAIIAVVVGYGLDGYVLRSGLGEVLTDVFDFLPPIFISPGLMVHAVVGVLAIGLSLIGAFLIGFRGHRLLGVPWGLLALRREVVLFWLAAGMLWFMARQFNSGAALEDFFEPRALDYLSFQFIWSLALVGVVGPAVEELIFRGILHRAVRDRAGPLAATFVSAVAFALVHVSNSPYQLQMFLFSGLLYAGAYECTRSLWAPIAMHAAGNSALIVATYGMP